MIVTIQSSVAVGHVGNSAAAPLLNALGHVTARVDTVGFSNHPGHGSFRGRVYEAAEVEAILEGVLALAAAEPIEAVISGYLGAAETAAVVGAAVASVKRANPGAIYLCDPVMGDADVDSYGGEGRGDQPGGRLFVRPGVPEAIAEHLIGRADIVTPNRFELELLVGRRVASLDEAWRAAETLRARLAPDGPGIVVVTSFDGLDTPVGSIDTLAFDGTGAWRARQPRLARRFDGAGDCFAAMFLSRWLTTRSIPDALGTAAARMMPLLRRTIARGGHDLALIASLPEMIAVAPEQAPRLD